MLKTDDLTSMTDPQLAKWHADARGAPAEFEILAENEWRMRTLRTQHKLHKRVVIIVAIISALSGILGGLIQKYAPEIRTLLKNSPIHRQMQSNKDINTGAIKLPKELDETATIEENVSSKQPPIKSEKPR